MPFDEDMYKRDGGHESPHTRGFQKGINMGAMTATMQYQMHEHSDDCSSCVIFGMTAGFLATAMVLVEQHPGTATFEDLLETLLTVAREAKELSEKDPRH